MSIRVWVLCIVTLAVTLGIPARGGADDCVPGCASDGRACLATARAEHAGCRAACAGASGEDLLACRSSCRHTWRAARLTCRNDFATCGQSCTGSCSSCGIGLAACAGNVAQTLRSCASGCRGDATCLGDCAAVAGSGRNACRETFTGCQEGCGGARATAPVNLIEVIPPATVSANPGQTVYLTYTVVNRGPTATFRYVPSFVATGAARVRSVSGAPSSSGQTLGHNAKKSIKVGVRVDSSAPGGSITVTGVFRFVEPQTVTVTEAGTISVNGLPTIVARCRADLVGDHSVRLTIEVQNLGREVVKAVRATRAVEDSFGGARFTVTSGRSPSVVYRLEPGQRTHFTVGGGWNKRGVLRIFEGATATTRLNRPIASALAECLPELVGR